jgi:hypothetical protein
MYNFVINENDPVYVMRQNLEASLLTIKKEKYNIILSFINKLFNINYKSLCKINGLYFDYIKDEYASTVIDEFSDNIKKHFKIDVHKKYKDDPSKIIYPLLTDMLKTIDYYLCKKIIKNEKTKADKIVYIIIAK